MRLPSPIMSTRRAISLVPMICSLLAAAPTSAPTTRSAATTRSSATRPATTRAIATPPTSRPAATVGEAFPPFRLTRVDGKLATNETLIGKPSVILFASWSAPSSRDQLPRVADLAARYGGRVNWLVIYTRELFPTTGPSSAGPQRNIDDKIIAPPAGTEAERLSAARQIVERLKLKLEVAPDAIDDRLAQAANAFPNAAFVLDGKGTIVARLEWAEPFAIKRHLDRLLATK